LKINVIREHHSEWGVPIISQELTADRVLSIKLSCMRWGCAAVSFSHQNRMAYGKHFFVILLWSISPMNKVEFHTRWLSIISIFITLAGIIMAFLKDSILLNVLNSLFNPIFWPSNSVDAGSILFKDFVISLLGALMAMWGVLLFGIVRNAFRKKQLWAWNTILFSTLMWFCIDEFFSVYYNVWVNAFGNILLFVLLIFPLAMTRNQMKR
jgi:hypothetical protein